MAYKIRLPLPPEWNTPHTIAELENKLNIGTGIVAEFYLQEPYITIIFAQAFSPTTAQKTLLRTNIKALYDPDVA